MTRWCLPYKGWGNTWSLFEQSISIDNRIKNRERARALRRLVGGTHSFDIVDYVYPMALGFIWGEKLGVISTL